MRSTVSFKNNSKMFLSVPVGEECFHFAVGQVVELPREYLAHRRVKKLIADKKLVKCIDRR